MQQTNAKYYFRKQDYNRIKHWYSIAKHNFVPQDTTLHVLDAFKTDHKVKNQHFKFKFNQIVLEQSYCFLNLKKLNSSKQIILLSNIYHRERKTVLSYGKQLVKNCRFDFNEKTIHFDQIVFYFYLQALQLKEYYFCLELRIINQHGELQKLGSSKYALFQQGNPPKVRFIIREQLFGEQLALQQSKNLSKVNKHSKSREQLDLFIKSNPEGYIQVQLDLEQIKDMTKLLPQLRIIDNDTKVGLAVELQLNKKKDQLVIDTQHKITLDDLMIKIEDSSQLKRQLIENNPFLLSHKDMVQLQIKEYSILIDLHNGWKFINANKNQIKLDLIVENDKEIYLSSKFKEKPSFWYYQSDNTAFVGLIFCRVQFKIKGIVQQKRNVQFMLGWVPLPLDLSLQQNKIDIFLINDIPFPDLTTTFLNIKCSFSAVVIHPLYQKYKNRSDERFIHMKDLPIDQNTTSEPNRYVKLHQKTKLTDISTQDIQLKKSQLQKELLAIKNMIEKNELQKQVGRLVQLSGSAQLGEQKVNQRWNIDRQDCVGRILNVRIELKSLIPQTDSPSSYYLPKRAKLAIYFLRHHFQFNWHITQNKIIYHVPVSLNTNKQCYIKIPVSSVQEFQLIINSRLVLVVYEEDSNQIYAKSMTSIQQILGSYGVEHVSFLKLINLKMMSQGIKESSYGTIMINSVFQIEKTKPNYSIVEESQISKDLHRLPTNERLKMRIGNYKGDQDVKSSAISLIKQKKHMQFITNTIQSKYYSNGQIQYELGTNSYYLLQYTNQDKSQNNIFTFHLDCPYAELVTQEQAYRLVIEDMHVEMQNYKKLTFVYHEKLKLSYYQTQLQYNQSIGLLIKLNFIQTTSPLKKIELMVKRNTLEVKRFILTCKYKQPLIWDYYQTNELLFAQTIYKQNELHVNLNPLISAKYRSIHIFSPDIKYDYRTKQLTMTKAGKSHECIVMQVVEHDSSIKKNILYELNMMQGNQISLTAGQRIKLPFPLDSNKNSIQIIRCCQRQVKILKRINFTSTEFIFQIDTKHFQLQFLSAETSRSIILNLFDIYQNKISSYLLKCHISLSKNTEVIEVNDNRHISISLQVKNPYGCEEWFQMMSDCNLLKFDERVFELDGYESKNACVRMNVWLNEDTIYIHCVDRLGNLIKTFQIKKVIPQLQHSQDNL